ncbi:hypothetical protein D5R93_01660 [Actinomyces lilanjuaniae]|uniref:Uncharacterized protein n=1 Tax=Actinomyces lilanjuaniae TaxID=2321394 RepID=A0ABN5PL63_9ACTO|nr:hypothetical protein [Actinomyces lilanjuaniae]AYD89080.1 hypothetical protein D5R93_01660 [Actinomyces lilanjuaniae]
MLGPDDGPTSHFGEAETIVVIRRRPELYGSIFVTDDRGARSHADAENAVDRCLGTAELLAYFEAAGWVTRSQVHDYLDTLRDNDRHVRPSDAGGYDRLVERLLRKKRGSGRSP